MHSLHTAALSWLRYGKRMPVVCTEVGAWNADVIGMNSAMVIEVEVKKSISDLRADFKNKPQKHYTYSEAENYAKGIYGYVPNYLYYFVPEELATKAEEIVREKCPKAGVAALGRYGVNIVKRPSKLHPRPPSPSFLRTAISRMSSEICITRMLLDKFKANGGNPEMEVLEQALDAAARVDGTLDFEDPIGNLEQRGAELAWVVDRKEWKSLSDLERFRWIFAAQHLLTLRRPTEKDVRDAEVN
jgi:hypothetical protein